MSLDQAGTLSGVRRHDYLPYGEELSAGMGGRTPGQGYAADSLRQQFTGYERDAETRLDFAQARYYSSSQGRFTSPDPLGASMRATDPQSFNRYSYTGNDPVNRTDSSGLDWTADASNWGGGSVYYQNNIFELDRVLGGRAGAGGEFDWSPVDPIPVAPPAEGQPEEEVTEEVTVTVLDAVEEIAEPQNPVGPVVDASDLGDPPSPLLLLPIRTRYMTQNRAEFELAFQEATSRLNNGTCAALFGGRDAALQTLFSTEYRVVPLASGGPRMDPITGAVNVTAAQTNSPTSVFINSRGPFFQNRMSVPGRGMITLDFNSRLRGAQFGALLLLHELGHQRGIFGADAHNLKINLAHTQRVLNACFGGIRIR